MELIWLKTLVCASAVPVEMTDISLPSVVLLPESAAAATSLWTVAAFEIVDPLASDESPPEAKKLRRLGNTMSPFTPLNAFSVTIRYCELMKVVLAMLTRFKPAIASPVSMLLVAAPPSETRLRPLDASSMRSLSIVASPTILTSNPSCPLQIDSSQLVRSDASRKSMVGAVSVKLEKRMPPGELIKVVLRRLRTLARTVAEPERMVGFEICGVVLVDVEGPLDAGQLAGGLPDPEPVPEVEDAFSVSPEVVAELEPETKSSPRKPFTVVLAMSEIDSITVDDDRGISERKSSTKVPVEDPVSPMSSAPVMVAWTSVLSCSSLSEMVASTECDDEVLDSLASELEDDCSSCVCVFVALSDDSPPLSEVTEGDAGSSGAVVDWGVSTGTSSAYTKGNTTSCDQRLARRIKEVTALYVCDDIRFFISF